MQALRAYPLAIVAVLGVGCHVEGSIKASTSEETRSDVNESAAAPAATMQTTTAAAPPPVSAPSAPPADACPLQCYEARGSEAIPLTNEEVTQLRSALEPVVGRMRQCVSPEEWRRHGSATVNLRIAPDGTLADLGIDPGHGGQTQCFDDAGRGASASVTLPGHKVVRCAERCVRENPRRGRRAR
jgi:hypothetical protein